MAPGTGPSESHLQHELNATVSGLLGTLCGVLGALYTAYTLMQRFVLVDPRLRPIEASWAASAVLFLGAAIILKNWRPPAPLAHPMLAATAALVIANSLRLLFHGGPLLANVLILSMVGYATLALSLPWLLVIVASTLTGVFTVIALAPPDPSWQPTVIIVVSSAAIAILVQVLRLRAMKGLIRLRHEQIKAETQRHRAERNRLRVDLINAAAHEVATPLTPLVIELHALKKSPNLSEAEARRLDVMERNLLRLRQAVESLGKLAQARDETEGEPKD